VTTHRDTGRMLRHSTARAVKFLEGVTDRQVRVVASDGTRDRMGDILDPAGAELDQFRRNPVVLAQHDSSQPIARCPVIAVSGNQVVATIEFPAAGVSARSDEYLALLKAGVISAVSVGFIPLARSPLNDGGYRFTSWELLELSVVSVPANANALVLERSYASPSTIATNRARAIERRARYEAQGALPPGEPEIDWAALHAEREEIRRRERVAGIIAANAALGGW
jgi:HK97 family phage prohead protease